MDGWNYDEWKKTSQEWVNGVMNICDISRRRERTTSRQILIMLGLVKDQVIITVQSVELNF